MSGPDTLFEGRRKKYYTALALLYAIMCMYSFVLVVKCVSLTEHNRALRGVTVFLLGLWLFSLGRVVQQSMAVVHTQVNDIEAFGRYIDGNYIDACCFTLFYCLKMYLILAWTSLFDKMLHPDDPKLVKRQRILLLCCSVLVGVLVLIQIVGVSKLAGANDKNDFSSGQRAYKLVYSCRFAFALIATIAFALVGGKLLVTFFRVMRSHGLSKSKTWKKIGPLGVVAFGSFSSFALRIVLDFFAFANALPNDPSGAFVFCAYFFLEILTLALILVGLTLKISSELKAQRNTLSQQLLNGDHEHADRFKESLKLRPTLQA